MESWVPWSLLALVSWGFWGLFPKLSTNYIDPKSALVFEALAGALVGIVGLSLMGFKPESNPKGVLFAGLTGLTALLGAWFYVNAASRGKISLVVTVTALYPAITLLLSFVVLKEPIEMKQWIGVLFAIISIALVAS